MIRNEEKQGPDNNDKPSSTENTVHAQFSIGIHQDPSNRSNILNS